jgi:hypothetical protein
MKVKSLLLNDTELKLMLHDGKYYLIDVDAGKETLVNSKSNLVEALLIFEYMINN